MTGMLKVSGYNEKQFAALQTFEDIRDINRAWNTIRENITNPAKESIGHCESKHHKQ
jgi:hypothetical protein